MDTDIPDFVMGECPAPIIYDHLMGPPFEGVNGVTTPTPGYDDAKKQYPAGWKAPKPYLRIVPQPKG